MRASIVVLVASLALSSQAHARSVAILPFTSLGLSEDALLSVEGAFREAVRTTPGVKLQDRAATITGLGRARAAGITCDVGDDACLQGLGGVLEVDEIVSGTISEDPYKYGVALKILDVAAGTSKKKGPSSISKDPSELYVGLRRAAAELLGVATGAIEVALEAAGARVRVDGVERGATPLEAIDDVPVGVRRIEVTTAEGATWMKEVDVKPGERTRIALAVVDGALVEAEATPVAAPEPSGPRVSWPLAGIGGAAIGVGVAAIVAGVVAYAVADGAYAALEQGVASGATDDELARHRDTNRAWALAPLPLYIVGGTAIAAGVGVVAASFITDPFGE